MRVALLSLVLLSANQALAAEATPANRAAAREHYEAGARKFDVGKFDEAAAEFQQAYELIGDPAILYNIAKSYQLAQNLERARFFYQSYLRRVENPPNRQEVIARINELNVLLQQQKKASEKPPTGILRNPPDSTTKPPDTTTKPPEQPPPEQPKPPDTTAKPPEQPPPEQPPPEQPPEKKETGGGNVAMKGVGFGLIGLAVVGIAVGGAMAGLAANAASKIERAGAAHDPFGMQAVTVQSNGATYDSAAIASFVIGGVAAAGGAVALYFGFRPQRKTTAIAPVVSPHMTGVVISGGF